MEYIMTQIEQLLEMWKKDCEIDRTEPGKALLDVPKLHSKYLDILSRHRLLSKDAELNLSKMKRLKWEFYTGKLDEKTLKEKGWEPFPFTLKSEIAMYLESDEDIARYVAKKAMHDEIVELCQSILKELNSRTYQLKTFVDWEKFIQGS